VPLIPVREVLGVGEAREERFVAAGIVTAQDLAAASPEEIAKIGLLSTAVAMTLIANAQELIASIGA
jgi:predicted RecB family nuclease